MDKRMHIYVLGTHMHSHVMLQTHAYLHTIIISRLAEVWSGH